MFWTRVSLVALILSALLVIGCAMTFEAIKTNLEQPVSEKNQISESAEDETTNSLPEKFMLQSVPHNPVKQTGNDCGPDSLRMVLNYYDAGVREGDIVRKLKSRGKSGGVSFMELASIARQYGFEAYLMSGVTFDMLKAMIVNGWPPIVGYRVTRSTGHAVVVVGYDDTRKFIRANDPNYVKVSRIEYRDFIPAWKQWGNSTLLIVPKGTTKEQVIDAISKYVPIEVK